MSDALDGVRDHDRATGLTQRLKTATLANFGPEVAATAELGRLAGTRLYREIRRVLKSGGRLATFDVMLKSGKPHYPMPWARTPATSFLLTAAATREAIEPTGFRTLAWQDDTEAAKAWFALLRASGPPASPNLGVVMGPDFAQLSANLGRDLMEGRLGILTAVFEAASMNS
jgi:hypothetical protein